MDPLLLVSLSSFYAFILGALTVIASEPSPDEYTPPRWAVSMILLLWPLMLIVGLIIIGVARLLGHKVLAEDNE